MTIGMSLDAVLATLAENRGRTIDRHVSKIREKIEPDRDVPTYLQTLCGRGYRFLTAQCA
jgi:DNA-binding response OmpR family regulator